MSSFSSLLTATDHKSQPTNVDQYQLDKLTADVWRVLEYQAIEYHMDLAG